MRYLVLAVVALLSLAPDVAEARPRGGSARVRSAPSGRFVGGRGGSSHKGGKYFRPATGNHYRKRK